MLLPLTDSPSYARHSQPGLSSSLLVFPCWNPPDNREKLPDSPRGLGQTREMESQGVVLWLGDAGFMGTLSSFRPCAATGPLSPSKEHLSPLPSPDLPSQEFGRVSGGHLSAHESTVGAVQQSAMYCLMESDVARSTIYLSWAYGPDCSSEVLPPPSSFM